MSLLPFSENKTPSSFLHHEIESDPASHPHLNRQRNHGKHRLSSTLRPFYNLHQLHNPSHALCAPVHKPALTRIPTDPALQLLDPLGSNSSPSSRCPSGCSLQSLRSRPAPMCSDSPLCSDQSGQLLCCLARGPAEINHRGTLTSVAPDDA